MMKKIFASFGDSWPAGVDLLPGQQTYGELLAKSKQFEHAQYSQGHTAVEHMVLQLQEFLTEHSPLQQEVTALFSITELSRFACYQENSPKIQPECCSIMVNDPTPGHTPSEAYFRYIWSEPGDHFKFYNVIMTLQSLCRMYNIKDYYLLSFSRVNWDLLKGYHGIDRNKFWDHGKSNILTMFGLNRVTPGSTYFAGSATDHPNQLGHQLVADKLAPWIG